MKNCRDSVNQLVDDFKFKCCCGIAPPLYFLFKCSYVDSAISYQYSDVLDLVFMFAECFTSTTETGFYLTFVVILF